MRLPGMLEGPVVRGQRSLTGRFDLPYRMVATHILEGPDLTTSRKVGAKVVEAPDLTISRKVGVRFLRMPDVATKIVP